jgi:hypothetical protein
LSFVHGSEKTITIVARRAQGAGASDLKDTRCDRRLGLQFCFLWQHNGAGIWTMIEYLYQRAGRATFRRSLQMDADGFTPLGNATRDLVGLRIEICR